MIDWLKLKLFGPCSSFRVGQAVVVEGENLLMVVIEIHTNRKLKSPLVECQWYDTDTSSTRRNLFPEYTLTEFNWEAAWQALAPK